MIYRHEIDIRCHFRW